jgi:hypothetical protein
MGQDTENAAVGFDDCRRELLDRAGGQALREYRSWRERPGYGEVVEFVENFTHRYLFEITPDQAMSVVRRSTGPRDHALGDVASKEQMKEVENATVPFAFQHLFHRYIEEKRALPSWREFGAWLKGPAAQFWLKPLMKKTGWRKADEGRRERLGRAYRWRAGKAYYSAFREVELLARLRTIYGLPIRYHVLADVLLGVDFWLGDILVCIYFPNEKYRSGGAGRKVHPSVRFAAADPPFDVMDIRVERQGYGKFWLVSDDSVERIALALRRAQAGADRG